MTFVVQGNWLAISNKKYTNDIDERQKYDRNKQIAGRHPHINT
jgi:hypothetical protein